MRVALVSDIHGNLVALEAVVADVAKVGPDAVICLCAVAVTGPQPRQLICRLRQLCWLVVMGKPDAWLLDPQPWSADDEEARRLLEVELWSASVMKPDDLDFVRTFQPTVALSLGARQDLLCYHGSPRSKTDFIGLETPEDELLEKLLGKWATVMAGGHTHQQMLRRFDDAILVNPGSVGLPYEMRDGRTVNPSWAEYALLAAGPGGLRVEFRRVPVDVEAVTAAVTVVVCLILIGG
ncbi:MAG: metallophosphoesterase [Chloroflexi bacterium]|jgi:predicted phosphodiesterase|nr:metallophosphoesterase [Chloroflexota bacterium]